jgi:hypothetical protein
LGGERAYSGRHGKYRKPRSYLTFHGQREIGLHQPKHALIHQIVVNGGRRSFESACNLNSLDRKSDLWERLQGVRSITEGDGSG